MALGSDGTVFVGTRAQTVHAVVDRNKDFKADEVLTVASGLTSPNGVAFKDGALYVAENSRDLALRRRARLRQGRRRQRPGPEADRADRQAAARPHARLEVSDLRTRRPALQRDRRAGQHPRSRRSVRDDHPHEARAEHPVGNLRPRRPQHRRLHVASRHAGDVVHRERPRHARRRARRTTSSTSPRSRASTSAIRTATRATPSIRNSARGRTAPTTSRRHRTSDRTSPLSA